MTIKKRIGDFLLILFTFFFLEFLRFWMDMTDKGLINPTFIYKNSYVVQNIVVLIIYYLLYFAVVSAVCQYLSTNEDKSFGIGFRKRFIISLQYGIPIRLILDIVKIFLVNHYFNSQNQTIINFVLELIFVLLLLFLLFYLPLRKQNTQISFEVNATTIALFSLLFVFMTFFVMLLLKMKKDMIIHFFPTDKDLLDSKRLFEYLNIDFPNEQYAFRLSFIYTVFYSILNIFGFYAIMNLFRKHKIYAIKLVRKVTIAARALVAYFFLLNFLLISYVLIKTLVPTVFPFNISNEGSSGITNDDYGNLELQEEYPTVIVNKVKTNKNAGKNANDESVVYIQTKYIVKNSKDLVLCKYTFDSQCTPFWYGTSNNFNEFKISTVAYGAILLKDSKGKYKCVYAKDISDLPQNEMYISTFNKLILQDNIIPIISFTDYLLKYDKQSIIPLLERYSKGEFTEDEIKYNNETVRGKIIPYAKAKLLQN